MTASALVSLMHPFYGSLLLFIIAVVFEQRKCWHFIWQLNGWRGIIQQPMLWILLMCYIDPKSIMTSIQRFRKYFQFPLAIILFNRILLYVDDPVTMEGILTAPECLNKTFMQNGFYANKGLLHAKDEKWKIRRKQLNPAFSHNTLISFLGDFNRVGHELSLKLAAVVQNDGKIPFADLEDLVSRAVLEVSCLTTMGVSTNFTQNDEKGIAAAYRHLMEITALRILKPWYQIDFLFRLLDRTKYEKTKKANKLVEDFVAQIVHEKHIEWQKGQQMQHDKGVNATQVANTTSVIAATEPQQSSWRTEQGDEQNGNHKVATIADDALPNASVAEHRIFIDQIFHLEQTGKLTLQDVMNESQSMVVVSFETVSTCIINALLCLAINHDCQVKLRQEIKRQLSKQTVTPLRHFPEDSDVGDVADSTAHAIGYNCSRCTGDTNDDNDNNDVELDVDVVENVTMSHLQRMPYLDMILNESLRLLTTVPMNLRNVSAEFQLNIIARQNHIQQPEQPQHQRDPTASLQYIQSKDKNKNVVDNNSNNRSQRNTSFSGRRVVTVPKGTMIALDTFNMQRNKDYWGTNASTFYPEYFAKERQPEGTIQGAARHSYAFIPFSKGLRTCIGHRYSIYLSKIILCKLISSFDFTTNVQLKDLQYCESVSLKYRNSKDIYFTLRQVSDE